MNKDQIQQNLAEIANFSPEDILAWAVQKLGPRIALASSFGAEDQVLLDMIARNNLPITVFSIDTGRLPQETYDLIDMSREKYNLDIEVLFPDPADIEPILATHGANSFKKSIDLRKSCCRARKVKPLKRKLKNLSAWITGLRRSQTSIRADITPLQWDSANKLIKINPLVEWSEKQLWDYIHQNKIPYNALHDRGYPSIGCLPCTRAIKEGEDIRAGRWWWESPDQKECGLHVVDGKLVRKITGKE